MVEIFAIFKRSAPSRWFVHQSFLGMAGEMSAIKAGTGWWASVIANTPEVFGDMNDIDYVVLDHRAENLNNAERSALAKRWRDDRAGVASAINAKIATTQASRTLAPVIPFRPQPVPARPTSLIDSELALRVVSKMIEGLGRDDMRAIIQEFLRANPGVTWDDVDPTSMSAKDPDSEGSEPESYYYI